MVTFRMRAVLVTILGLLGLVGAVVLVVKPAMQTGTASVSTTVPAPDVDEPARTSGASATAVLAGGCFWGVQGVFQHVNGVTEAESGYVGGEPGTANYDAVSAGGTGHAEAVRITYDPSQVTYGQLLQVFFAVVQDPTQLDRQGPDVGSQYRSAIFTQDASQQRVAEGYIAQLDDAAVFAAPIVTSVSPGSEFFPAEQYHQDFLVSNPSHPYIAMHDMPKLDGLKQLFPERYRDRPVLVLANDG